MLHYVEFLFKKVMRFELSVLLLDVEVPVTEHMMRSPQVRTRSCVWTLGD